MAVDREWRVDGGRELVADLRAGALAIHELMPVVVEKAATDLVSLTQQNASHRPGPNAPTGDYRGSWKPERVFAGSDFEVWAAGTDRAQANRLEHGFIGVDSLGRQYDQPPYPHHGPAVDVIEPNFHAAMEKVAERAIRW